MDNNVADVADFPARNAIGSRFKVPSSKSSGSVAAYRLVNLSTA
jgi:hypothetical protein